jgi:pantoate--beta-alanine ligase
VSILLNLVQPARAYFGEKDYQQLQVVRRFHHDLALPGEIVGCPTIRDEDGLALSSRNRQLSTADRAVALGIPRAIAAVQAAAKAGETNTVQLQRLALEKLTSPGISADYVAIVDGTTLESLTEVAPGARVMIAATAGGVRLIDNDAVTPMEHSPR